MKFFQSEVVRDELNRMQDLYLEINKMGLMLTTPQKREQLDKMIELINLQQTMYMRVTYLTTLMPNKWWSKLKMLQQCLV